LQRFCLPQVKCFKLLETKSKKLTFVNFGGKTEQKSRQNIYSKPHVNAAFFWFFGEQGNKRGVCQDQEDHHLAKTLSSFLCSKVLNFHQVKK